MQKTRRAFTLVELLVVIAIIGLLIAITIPSTGKALSRAKRLQCSSNLKQLSAAMLLYCKDNQGKFPIVFKYQETQWGESIIPYLGKKYENWNPNSPAKERLVFFCPTALKHHPGTYETKHGSYGMNVSFMKDNEDEGPSKSLFSYNKTSQTVMLGDGRWVETDGNWGAGLNIKDDFYSDDYPEDKNYTTRSTFVHEEGANFVYLDGHTDWLPYSFYSDSASNTLMWTGTTNASW